MTIKAQTDHGGPRTNRPRAGALQYAKPETAQQRHDRHVDAIVAVLRGRMGAARFTDDWVRASAECCLAAAETGV